MNERIKELAEQAWAYQIRVYEDNGVRTYGEREKVFNKEKFAELIVKECAKVASDYDGAHYVGTAIEQHFGVEL